MAEDPGAKEKRAMRRSFWPERQMEIYLGGRGGRGRRARVVTNFLADFDLTLALCGCRAVSELDRAYLARDGSQKG